MQDALHEIRGMLRQQLPAALDRFDLEYNNPSGYWHTPTDPIERLNAFWRYKLATVPVDTIAQRECLCTSPDQSAWVRNFRRMILPTVMLYVYAPIMLGVG
jgi:hypothetical protein